MSGSTIITALVPIAFALFPAALIASQSEKSEGRFSLLSDEDCWRKLPPAEKGRGQPLPSWARALAGPMPRTTAALLRLDEVHRNDSPLDPRLRCRCDGLRPMRTTALTPRHKRHSMRGAPA